MSYADENPKLFWGETATSVAEQTQQRLDRRIEIIPEDRFRGASVDEIVREILAEDKVQPLHVDRNDCQLKSLTQAAVGPDGNWVRLEDRFRPANWERGIHVTLSIPYTGTGNLWHFNPTPEWLSELRGTVEEETDANGRLNIKLAVGGQDWDQVLAKRIDEELGRVMAFVEAQRPIITAWKESLVGHVHKAVASRRKFLAIVDDIPTRLDIPLIIREGRVDYRPIELRRREVEPVIEVTKPSSREYQYVLGFEGYEQILHICRHFGRSFEAAPKPLRDSTETDIRDFFLAALNTYFVGSAAPERFRRSGFTDICIEAESRAAFVGEFKLWNGTKKVHLAIDQISDYATWQDTKCAIVLFQRRDQSLSRTRQTLEKALTSHPLYRRTIPCDKLGEWRIKIAHDRAGDELTIHVFLFDIPIRRRRAKARASKSRREPSKRQPRSAR